jgi:hypothetical protein
MGTILPLFPLQLVVFPNEKLNLHIFEPRYKQLIGECEEEGITFCIPPYIDQKIMPFGTEVRLIKVEKKYETGEMDIRTEGLGLIKLGNIHNPVHGKMYLGAEIDRVAHISAGDYLKSEKIIRLTTELFGLLAIDKDPPSSTVGFESYQVAHQIGMSIQQEYELLQLLEEEDRQDYVIRHLDQVIPKVKEINHMKDRAMMNGHFRNIKPLDL